MPTTRHLAAILIADIARYSHLLEVDEIGTLRRRKALRAEIIDPKILEHNGRIVTTKGDSILAEFVSVIDALGCAVEIQAGVAAAESDPMRLPDRRIAFRIGIHQGDIQAEDDGDILGDGVNVAERLESLAEPGGIWVSGRVQEDSIGKMALVFEDMGEQSLKNIKRPVRAYRVRSTQERSICEWEMPRYLDPTHSIVRCQFSPVVPVFAFNNKHYCLFHYPSISEDILINTNRKFALAREADVDIIALLSSEVHNWLSSNLPIDLSGIDVTVPFNFDWLTDLLLEFPQAKTNRTIHLPQSRFWNQVQVSTSDPTLRYDFAQSKFYGNFVATNCVINTLELSKCTFSGVVRLGNLHRPADIGNLLASDATFSKGVIGHELSVRTRFDISNVDFQGKPNSMNIRDSFCNDVKADGLSARGQICITNTEFAGDVNLEEAKLSHEFVFINNHLLASTTFKNSEFRGKIDFNGSKFEGQFDLTATIRDAAEIFDADFSSCKFRHEAKFRNREFGGQTDFNGCVFKQAPDFSGTSLGHDTSFADAIFHDFDSAHARHRYRTLRKQIDRSKSAEDYGAVLEAEMRSSIKASSVIVKCILISYFIVANYGKDTFGAVKSTLVAIVVFACAYFVVDIVPPRWVEAWGEACSPYVYGKISEDCATIAAREAVLIDRKRMILRTVNET
jgi:class 3 adenylate cyclase/uncharacterized protein YjbI with pentapeptide repeats